jgi:hypothetical protein
MFAVYKVALPSGITAAVGLVGNHSDAVEVFAVIETTSSIKVAINRNVVSGNSRDTLSIIGLLSQHQ